MNNFHKSILLFSSIGLFTISSCQKKTTDTPDGGQVGKGRYIIAVYPTAAGNEGVADYLLTSETLMDGSITTIGNGVEQDGTYRYYTTSGNKFFSMLYGQGNPGAVTVYNLDSKGALNKLTNFQSETVQAFAPVENDILMIKESRNYNSPISRWFRVSTESLTIVGEGQYNAVELASNGELAHVSWIKQVGNKVFKPYFCIKATDDGGWTTSYPDSSWIAVYSYPDMQLEKVIRDNRTSSIGLYFMDGLALTENGDVYAFSPANTMGQQGTEEVPNGTKPSAVVRINAGTTEFDQNYFYNIEEASNGYYIGGWLYVGNGKAIATMQKKSNGSQWGGGNYFAVIDLVSKQFTWVNGINGDSIADGGISSTNYTTNDGIGYFGVTLSNGESYVYKLDANTATATRGLKVEGGQITAIQWLPAE